MFNVCPNCGMYSDEKSVDPKGPFAICPQCGYAHRFVQLPLFVVTGASGTGKTMVCLELVARMPECVCLECDIFWRPEFATPADDYRGFRNLCLRAAKNIGQNGRPVVLFGSAIPQQYEACPERRYFTETHYLALVCDEKELVRRLQERPRWRKSAEPEVLEKMIEFNYWLGENAHTTQPITDNTRYDFAIIEPVKTRGLAGKQTIHRTVKSILHKTFFHCWDDNFLFITLSPSNTLPVSDQQ